MGIFDAIDISATGLTAQRMRMNLISENLANINTTRTPQGGPYKRKEAIFAALDNTQPFASFLKGVEKGVHVLGIIEDESLPKKIYEPHHPEADAQGYVATPNIDTVTEMVNMISAARAYEANVSVISSAKRMMEKALEIGR